jgi:hypothetical protein
LLKKTNSGTIPRGADAQYCFNFLDADHTKGCEGVWDRTQKAWKPCTRLHFDLGTDPRSQADKKSLARVREMAL